MSARSHERRHRLLSGGVLLIVMAGHALRETARDTFFLSDLPARRLPWAYLAIALLTLGIGTLARRLLARFPPPALLAVTLAVGAVVDVGFWGLAAAGRAEMIFPFYVWTGLFSTAVTLLFWLQMADVFDVAEAKRSFAPIAAGGLIGAVVGSSAASLLLLAVPTRALLLASALLCASAAALPLLLPVASHPASQADPEATEAGKLGVGDLVRNSYLLRLLALAGLTAVLATGIDFVFKSEVALAIPRERLGLFFARFQAAVNLAALVFQLLLAPVILRSLGVTRALATLPTLLVAGSAAAVASASLLPVLLLKATDGALRHSLHRASTEILYLPLPKPLRGTFKTLAESVGQRGGQAVASVAILVAIAWNPGERTLALALLATALLAMLPLARLRRDYVARFREQLRGLRDTEPGETPRLDLNALEVLVSSLSSPQDAEVLSALDLLEAHGRVALVPPLILHHPSRAVVLRALELLSPTRHPHLDAMLEQLLAHDDPEIRCAALSASAARRPGGAPIVRLARNDPSLAVRATALVAWLGRGGDAGELDQVVKEILAGDDRLARLALARALLRLPDQMIRETARQLVDDPDEAVPAELAVAAAGQPRREQIPLLIALLGRREARPAARAALLALGTPALQALATALRDAELPDAVRRHLPRTLSRFASPEAAALLVETVESDDPRIRYKALRGLGRMRANDPALPIPPEPVQRLAEHSLRRAVTMLYYLAVYEAWSPGAQPEGDDLLRRLLEEKQQRALERVFRALHILEPEQEYAAIFDAVRAGGRTGAGSREILENLVEGPLREGLLAVVDAGEPSERLRAALGFWAPAGAGRFLELLDGRRGIEAPSPAERAALDELAGAFFADALRDPDPVLVSVARWTLRRGGTRLHRELAHA